MSDLEKKILNLYRPTKSKSRCALCNSRACYDRVFTRNGAFDELACRNHVLDVYRLSDIMQPGVLKVFSSSTGKESRGNAMHDFEEFENELAEFQTNNK